jgi:hypothetical protein
MFIDVNLYLLLCSLCSNRKRDHRLCFPGEVRTISDLIRLFDRILFTFLILFLAKIVHL